MGDRNVQWKVMSFSPTLPPRRGRWLRRGTGLFLLKRALVDDWGIGGQSNAVQIDNLAIHHEFQIDSGPVQEACRLLVPVRHPRAPLRHDVLRQFAGLGLDGVGPRRTRTRASHTVLPSAIATQAADKRGTLLITIQR